jgi:signal transduction histidine kinase
VVWRQASFRQQLLAAFLAMALLPALLLAAISYVRARHLLDEDVRQIQARNLQGAISARNYLAAALLAGERVVDDLHDEPGLLAGPLPAVQARLRRQLADVPMGYDVTVLDRQGRIVASAGRLQHLAGRSLTGSWIGYDPQRRELHTYTTRSVRGVASGEAGLVVSRVIADPRGRPLGRVAVSYQLGAYRQQLATAAAADGGPALYVADQHGRLVFGTGGDRHFLLLEDLSDDRAVAASHNYRTGLIGPYRSPVADNALVGAFAVVPRSGWVVIVASDYDAIRQSSLQGVWSSLAVLLPAALLAMVAAFLLSRWYARPVTALVQMVRGMPDGHPVVPAPAARSASEFAVLADAIVETSQELAQSVKALEDGRLNLERLLDERSRSLVAMNRLVLQLAGTQDLAAALQAILPQLEAMVGADGTLVCLWDPDRQTLVPTARHVPGLDDPGCLFSVGSALFDRLAAGQPWLDAEMRPQSPDPGIARLALVGYECRIILPIRLRNGVLVGVVSFLCRQPRVYDTNVAARLEPIVEQLAMAIDRDQLLRDMQRRQQQAETLAQLAARFARSVRFDQVVAAVLEGLRETIGVERDQLWLLDDSGSEAICVAAAGPMADGAVGLRISIAAAAIHGQRVAQLAAGQPVILANQAEMAYDPVVLTRLETYSGIFLPLIASGRLFGAILLVNTQPRQYRPEWLAYAQAIAAQAASAIANARLFDRLEERRHDAEALARVASTLAQSLRLRDLAPRLLNELHTSFAADRAELWLADDDSQAAVCTAAVGAQAADVVNIRISRSLVGEWAQRMNTGQPVLVDDVQATPAGEHPLIRRFGVRAVALFPLMTEGRSIGFLMLHYEKPGARFPAERLPYAQAIAAQAASAVANARLFEQLEQRRLDAEVLVRVAGALSQSLRLEALAPAVLEAMRTSFATDHATLWLVDDEGAVATCLAGVGGRAAELVGMRSQRAEVPGIADRLMSGEPVLLPQVAESPLAALPLVPVFGIRAAAYFPLISSGQLIGFVLLTYERPDAVFPEARLDFGLAIASQAATAVANARLFERLEAALVHLQTVQEQLIRSERLSALGQLSSFVSHEIKNRFNVITTAASLAEMLAGRPGAQERIKQTMATIKKEVDRGNDLMLRLLRFAKPQEPSQEQVSLPAVLDAALLTARRANVRIVRHLPTDLPPVPGDPANLEQVFLNLILNALQAMPNGGTLTVAAAVVPPWVEVTIRDTGSGMAAETLSHLFQPFFTTKAQGTGLGLVITRQIIDQHRGAITCDSAPGQGTTFTIRLPLTRAQSSPPPDIGEAETGPGERAV